MGDVLEVIPVEQTELRHAAVVRSQGAIVGDLWYEIVPPAIRPFSATTMDFAALALQRMGQKAPGVQAGDEWPGRWAGDDYPIQLPVPHPWARRVPCRVAVAYMEPLRTLLPTVGPGWPLGCERSGLPHT